MMQVTILSATETFRWLISTFVGSKEDLVCELRVSLAFKVKRGNSGHKLFLHKREIAGSSNLEHAGSLKSTYFS